MVEKALLKFGVHLFNGINSKLGSLAQAPAVVSLVELSKQKRTLQQQRAVNSRAISKVGNSSILEEPNNKR